MENGAPGQPHVCSTVHTICVLICTISRLIRKKPVAERLVTTVLRDTTDGTEVWKTVSYMLLDCLVNLSRDDKHGNILSTLVRHGFLDVFVQDIKD
jgi:hypothetical protein